ncbi:hypothetical protein CIRG_08834 [Coccidioides immitis RMSCC 2394]|uniref:Uncharacterized protein n=1 Tax=Coccidioides immitis RMSCC 2394 TaxID=404692 RepID=A0A0J6YPM2_COCIT|nr:hypothetical protein CIRG_08834 [Coccidioides immitis RMSCC 2394]
MPVRVLTESPGQFYTTTTGKAWDEVGTANNHRYGYFSPAGTTIGLTMVDVAISGEIAAPSRRLLLSDEVGERRMGKRSDQPMCEEHGTGSGRTEMKVALKARDKIKRRSRERERDPQLVSLARGSLAASRSRKLGRCSPVFGMRFTTRPRGLPRVYSVRAVETKRGRIANKKEGTDYLPLDGHATVHSLVVFYVELPRVRPYP